MELDVLILARLQFAMTIMFHYLFPPLTIGLGGLIVSLEALYLKTREPQYEQAARFWTKIFAVNFAMGVATGIVMEFQFGTNWATYSRYVGDVFGSALAAEGIFAFFLESGFLAVLVFGWDKVSPKMHFFAACMVALGAAFSAVWIVAANSWQQTPAGFKEVVFSETGALRAEITSFWEMVLNHSTLHRLAHTLIGAYTLAAFFVMSISSFYILKGRHVDFARRSFTSAVILGAIMSIAAVVQGDFQARNVAQWQPAKLAAMEAHFTTGTAGAPLHLYGFPNQTEARVAGGIAVPGLLSFLVHGDFKTPVKGLDQFERRDWPPVAITFHAFHIMVGLGFLFVAMTLAGCYFLWRGTLFQKRWLLTAYVVAIPLPYIANQLGWVTAEVGRQPWTVYGLLRTADSLSKSVTASQTLGSIIMFGCIYSLLFAVFLYVLNDKIRHGPDPVAADADAAPRKTTAKDLADVASLRVETGSSSLTEPGDKNQPGQKGN